MTAYVLKRLVLAAITLFVILLVSYVLLRIAPGDPSRSQVMGSDSSAGTVDSRGGLASNRSMRRELHLDEPVLTGFSCWAREAILHGDFGKSATVDPGRPVVDIILERLPVTLDLNIWAVLVAYMLAVPAGMLGAVRADSTSDRAGSVLLYMLYSLPVMWVGLLAQTLVCDGGVWHLLPLGGCAPADADSIGIWRLQWELLRHRILPVVCLSYGGFASLSRFVRSGMLETLNCDFVRTARAKGLGEPEIIFGHCFRNALIPLITLLGGLLPGLVSGSVIVEYIFNIPGTGNLALLSLSSRDYPLQMALFFFSGALTLLGILLSDLLYMAADPRIRLAK